MLFNFPMYSRSVTILQKMVHFPGAWARNTPVGGSERRYRHWGNWFILVLLGPGSSAYLAPQLNRWDWQLSQVCNCRPRPPTRTTGEWAGSSWLPAAAQAVFSPHAGSFPSTHQRLLIPTADSSAVAALCCVGFLQYKIRQIRIWKTSLLTPFETELNIERGAVQLLLHLMYLNVL